MSTGPEMDHLGRRTVAGGAWLLLSRMTQQGVSLIQITLLARLLDPTAFGLAGLASLATYAIGVFVYTGFEQALIQRTDLRDEDIHTTWWAILVRYLALAVILALLANPIARLYRTPDAVPILVAFALVQPIHGLASMSTVLFKRHMQFRKVFMVDAYSAVAGLVVGIVAAIILRSVWALVLAYLAMALTVLLLSYRLHPYRPRWCFERGSAQKLLNYGRWLLGSNILWFVSSQGASAFSGWMFGVAALGIYQMAARFALLPSTQISDVIQSTLMPAYSQIQEDENRVSRVFLKGLGLTAVLIIGLTLLVALGLPRLLVLLLGEQWAEAAALVPAIALAGGAQAMLRTGSPVYLGTGRPRFQFYVDVVQTAIMVVLLYPLGHLLGLVGLPLAAIGGTLCAAPVWWLGIRQSTVCTGRDVIAAFAPAIMGASVMIAVFTLGQIPAIAQISTLSGVIWHAIVICVAGLAFLAAVGLCQRVAPRYSPLVELRSILGS